MTKTFDELWRDLEERSKRFAIPIVQDYKELEHIFNLMKGCKSYLEVGSAEGNSLYVLGHTLKLEISNNRPIAIIDFGEPHTEAARVEAIFKLKEVDIEVCEILGNSHNEDVQIRLHGGFYDVVLIDAGHNYEDVIADAIAYGHLATKYIFFHDIQLPEVKRAYDWYLSQNPQFKHYEFINSETYGYGIVEV